MQIISKPKTRCQNQVGTIKRTLFTFADCLSFKCLVKIIFYVCIIRKWGMHACVHAYMSQNNKLLHLCFRCLVQISHKYMNCALFGYSRKPISQYWRKAKIQEAKWSLLCQTLSPNHHLSQQTSDKDTLRLHPFTLQSWIIACNTNHSLFT